MSNINRQIIGKALDSKRKDGTLPPDAATYWLSNGAANLNNAPQEELRKLARSLGLIVQATEPQSGAKPPIEAMAPAKAPAPHSALPWQPNPYDALPEQIKAAKAFLLWKLVNKPGQVKPAKVPYYISGTARKGRMDTPDDLAQLATFDAALAAYQAGKWNGIGIAVGAAFPCVVVDFDGRIPESFEVDGAWTEISQSGKGLHAFYLPGTTPTWTGNNGTGTELYNEKRFIALTGNNAAGAMTPYAGQWDAYGAKASTTVRERSNDRFELMAGRVSGWDAKRIQSELLSKLSADCNRDEWLRVAMGIMHQLGKTLEARELVREWSAMSKTKYDEGDFDAMWRSLNPDPVGKIPVTLASVIDMANKIPVLNIGRVDDVAPQSFDVEDEAPPRLPSPFPGALSELTEAILRASHIPQADMATLAALVGLAASIPGTFHFEDGLRVNLYGATLAFTGEGKEIPVNAAIEFATSKGAIVVSPASGEGLEDGIQPGFPTVCVIREAAHLFSVLAAKNAAPHLVSLSRNLLDFYSLNGRPFTPRSKAGGKAGAALDNVTMSALLASTPEKLGESLTTGNILDGLLGRILFAFGRMDSSPNLSTSAFAIPASLTFKPINATGGVITLADGVKAKADALGKELFNAKRKAQKSGNVIDAALLARTFEKIKRVAGTLAVWENNIVTMPMLEWAEALVRASDDGLKMFVRDRMHADDVRANAAKIVSAMKRVMHGSVKPRVAAQIALSSKGHISRALVQDASGLNPYQFAEASKHLTQCGEIETYWVEYTRTSGKQKAEAIRFSE